MESPGATNEAQGNARCVECGFPVKTLYIQYSPGNIRLMKCENCKVAADEYIECEIMILVIDLILHKPRAYRHLFFNSFSKGIVNFESLLWKCICALLVLDFYRMWVLSTAGKEWNPPLSVGLLLLHFGKILTGVIFGNALFFGVMFHAARKLFSSSSGFHGWKEILAVVLVSSYFKIFLAATLVWEFPSSVIFIIDMFVISSNIVALKAISGSAMTRCLGVGIVAHSFKLLVGHSFIQLS